jgi:sugar lactone lactonase YvrE
MAVEIKNVSPKLAVPGGELIIDLSGGEGRCSRVRVLANGFECTVRSSSSDHMIADLPAGDAFVDSVARDGRCSLQISEMEDGGAAFDIWCGVRVVGGMHLVANPAVDPSDGTLIVTRSGRRGEQLPATLFRVEPDGNIDEVPESVLNPTGVAFSPKGELFVSNRASGEVVSLGREGLATVFSSNLGIATGIAFDERGTLYVGDRSGRIYRVWEYGDNEVFAEIEPSVAAFHLAFGPDKNLYVSSPGLSSHDSIYMIEPDGEVSKYFTGFGRPQGLAFDNKGNLYVAACFKGRRGVYRIDAASRNAELFISGPDIVGLCFGPEGDILTATADSVYSFKVGIRGLLLK